MALGHGPTWGGSNPKFSLCRRQYTGSQRTLDRHCSVSSSSFFLKGFSPPSLGLPWGALALRWDANPLTDAQRRGVTVQEFVVRAQFRHVSRESNHDDAFSALLRDRAEAELVLDDPEHLSHVATIAELSLRHPARLCG